MEERFKEIVKEVCDSLSIEIFAIECDKDHTHMFLNALPPLSPSDIMAKIKGVSSKILREEFPYLLIFPVCGHVLISCRREMFLAKKLNDM